MNPIYRFGALLLSLATGLLHAQALTPEQMRTRNVPPQPTELARKIAGVSDIKQLLAVARKFESASEWRNLQDVYERIVQLQPNAGNIKYELAATYALQDEKRKAYAEKQQTLEKKRQERAKRLLEQGTQKPGLAIPP